jgi:hypothetical protein
VDGPSSFSSATGVPVEVHAGANPWNPQVWQDTEKIDGTAQLTGYRRVDSATVDA